MPPRKSTSPKPRPSKSPARTRSSSADSSVKPPSKAPSRAKTPPTGRARKSSSATMAVSEPEAHIESTPATMAPKPPVAPSGSNDCLNAAGFIIVLLVLVIGATLWPMPPTKAPQKPVLLVTAKGIQTLRKKTGNAVVIFMPDNTSCTHCGDLEKAVAHDEFEQQHHKWWFSVPRLRILKVYCNDGAAHEQFCESHGLGKYQESHPGWPHLRWFKDGSDVGPYEGARSLKGFQEWVQAREGEGWKPATAAPAAAEPAEVAAAPS